MSTSYAKYLNWKRSQSGSNFIRSKDNEEIQSAQLIHNELPKEEIAQRDRVDTKANRPRAKSTKQRAYNSNSSCNPTNSQQKPKTISFQLISYDSIDLSTDFTVSANLISIFRECQGRYNRETESWIFPYRNYSNIFKALHNIPNENITIIPISLFPIQFICLPQKLTQLKISIPKQRDFIIDYSKDPMHSLFELPSNLLSSLYKFQKEGIEFGIRKNCRLLLADEMGVGKTIQGIALSAIFKEDWPVLILCPSSLKFAWKDEITTWLSQIVNPKEVQIMKKTKDEFKPQCKYYIMSYELSVRGIEKIRAKNFNFAIVDEAHYLKNKDSKRSKTLIPLLQKCKRLLLLTGTPIVAKPVEAFPILTALRPDVFKSFKDFGGRYCNPQVRPFGTDWSGSSNSRELHFLLSKVMIRRLKVNVLSELPPKKRQKVEIPTETKILNQIRLLLAKHKMNFDLGNEETVKQLEQQEKEAAASSVAKSNKKKGKGLLNGDSTNDEDNDNTKDTKELGFLKAYRLTGQSKIPGIRNYITYLIDNSCKFLIFAHHLEVLDAIEDEVLKAKIDYIRIDGNVAIDKRHDRVKKFQTDDNCLVAILAITACATGLTLTKASTVVFAELHFTPATMIQAEDRAHRIGQEHQCVNVHYLYARDTVDEVVFTKLREKYFVVSSTLDNKASDMGVQKIKEKVGAFEKVKSDSNTKKDKDSVVVDSIRNKTLDSYFIIEDNNPNVQNMQELKSINLHSTGKRVREFEPGREVKWKEDNDMTNERVFVKKDKLFDGL